MCWFSFPANYSYLSYQMAPEGQLPTKKAVVTADGRNVFFKNVDSATYDFSALHGQDPIFRYKLQRDATQLSQTTAAQPIQLTLQTGSDFALSRTQLPSKFVMDLTPWMSKTLDLDNRSCSNVTVRAFQLNSLIYESFNDKNCYPVFMAFNLVPWADFVVEIAGKNSSLRLKSSDLSSFQASTALKPFTDLEQRLSAGEIAAIVVGAIWGAMILAVTMMLCFGSCMKPGCANYALFQEFCCCHQYYIPDDVPIITAMHDYQEKEEVVEKKDTQGNVFLESQIVQASQPIVEEPVKIENLDWQIQDLNLEVDTEQKKPRRKRKNVE